jgi:hypothetical protein
METRDRLARRFRIEAGLAAATAILFVLTLFSREWIEALTGWNPDGGNGSLEWFIVGALLVATVALAARARADWRGVQALPA